MLQLTCSLDEVAKGQGRGTAVQGGLLKKMGLLQVEKLSVLLASAGHPEQKRWASQPGLSVPGMAPILGGTRWHRSGAKGHGNESSVVLCYKCSGYLGRLDNSALTGACAGCGVSGSRQPSPPLLLQLSVPGVCLSRRAL